MDQVKILVVEDEVIIADNICGILEKLGYHVLEPAMTYAQALERMEVDLPDLALLDINLRGKKDGIDLAWTIKREFDVPFIFLTSNADPLTVDRAKRLSPPSYLVKPFNKDDLYTSIEMALYNYRGKERTESGDDEDLIIKNALFIRSKQQFVKVKLDDILFVKSDHVYVEVYTVPGDRHVIRCTLTKFTEQLPKTFFRIHRSYTVNLDHVDAINPADVSVAGHNVPVWKNYRNDLLSRLNVQ